MKGIDGLGDLFLTREGRWYARSAQSWIECRNNDHSLSPADATTHPGTPFLGFYQPARTWLPTTKFHEFLVKVKTESTEDGPQTMGFVNARRQTDDDDVELLDAPPPSNAKPTEHRPPSSGPSGVYCANEDVDTTVVVAKHHPVTIKQEDSEGLPFRNPVPEDMEGVELLDGPPASFVKGKVPVRRREVRPVKRGSELMPPIPAEKAAPTTTQTESKSRVNQDSLSNVVVVMRPHRVCADGLPLYPGGRVVPLHKTPIRKYIPLQIYPSLTLYYS